MDSRCRKNSRVRRWRRCCAKHSPRRPSMREIALGLLGGTLIGATGIGSGSLLTPLLILAGYKPSVAVSTGLATLIISKLAGSLAHRSLGNWPGRQGWFVVAGGVLGVAVV